MLEVYFRGSDPIPRGMIAARLGAWKCLRYHVAALAIKPRLRRLGARCLSRIWDEVIQPTLIVIECLSFTHMSIYQFRMCSFFEATTPWQWDGFPRLSSEIPKFTGEPGPGLLLLLWRYSKPANTHCRGAMLRLNHAQGIRRGVEIVGNLPRKLVPSFFQTSYQLWPLALAARVHPLASAQPCRCGLTRLADAGAAPPTLLPRMVVALGFLTPHCPAALLPHISEFPTVCGIHINPVETHCPWSQTERCQSLRFQILTSSPLRS